MPFKSFAPRPPFPSNPAEREQLRKVKMNLITFQTQIPLEKLESLLKPPHHSLPSWIIGEGSFSREVEIYVVSMDDVKSLCPDAIITKCVDTDGSIRYTDKQPLPAWFNTEGYVVRHLFTLQEGGKVDNRVFALNPR